MNILRLRQIAPDFTTIAVINNTFKSFTLQELRGKYVIMIFYPADFSFVCPTELHAFSDRAQEFRNIGCEILALSTDSHFVHLAWMQAPRKTGGLGEVDMPVLADKSCKISRDYGVYDENTGFAQRGLFIVDREGLLRQIIMNDMAVGRSVDEALRLVQAYQYSDEFGEVCPVNWKPGHRTIKPDSAGITEYFKDAT